MYSCCLDLFIRIKLKDVIDAEDIRNWKNLPMVKFETTVWHVLGDENVGKADRLLVIITVSILLQS